MSRARSPAAAALAAVALALALPAAARAAPASPVAFLGLRPVRATPPGETALDLLVEAQRLRATAEGAVEAVSGAPVLRHEPLRAALGRGYLVDLFACGAEPACQLALAAPLRRAGVESAIAGEVVFDGDVLHVRLRRLDLVRARPGASAEVELPRAAAAGLEAWRAALAPLFDDTGGLALVVNVTDAACLLDRLPCAPSPDGFLDGLPEGEHLLELSREGYKRASRVVAVARGERTRVAVALEELPVQAQRPPDPANRVPAFEPPGDEPKLVPFGFLRLALVLDDVNAGDREDPSVPAGVRPGRASLVALPRPALLGVGLQAPRQEGGWQLRGAISLAWVKDGGPEIDSAYAEVVHEDRGFRALLGQGPGIVSSLTAGTLTLPEGFGDLASGLVGVTVSQSFGPLLAEAFVGKHKGQFSAEASPGGAARGPVGAIHLAWVDADDAGLLYGKDFPLTLGLSGLYGSTRAGGGDEAAWAAANGIPSRRDDVPAWVASLEAFVPFGKAWSVGGEAFLGDDVAWLEGALWQAPRVDPATGRHAAIRSAGGWAQVAVNLAGGAWELRAVGGVDAAVSGLRAGLAPGGEPAVRRNGLVAVNAVRHLLGHLALGVQVHAIRTRYADVALGEQTLLGAVFSSQLDF